MKDVKRYCNVMTALDARRTARLLHNAGYLEHAAQSWELVRIHLRRSRKEKAERNVK